jgi:CubicO group peptidase (beta-lactamase class C family)
MSVVMAGGLLAEEEIQTYVPQFPKKRWPVTLRQLMGHVAGVRSDSGNEGPLFSQRCPRPVDALQHFADDDLLFEPGTQYRYSKYGWILVSAAVEAAAGDRFLTFMGEQIFQPLGMKDTGVESATEENPDHVGEPEEDAPFLGDGRQGLSCHCPERFTTHVRPRRNASFCSSSSSVRLFLCASLAP